MSSNWYAIRKVFRTHNSLTVVLPFFVKRALGVTTKTYLEFEYKPGQKSVRIRTVKHGGKHAK